MYRNAEAIYRQLYQAVKTWFLIHRCSTSVLVLLHLRSQCSYSSTDVQLVKFVIVLVQLYFCASVCCPNFSTTVLGDSFIYYSFIFHYDKDVNFASLFNSTGTVNFIHCSAKVEYVLSRLACSNWIKWHLKNNPLVFAGVSKYGALRDIFWQNYTNLILYTFFPFISLV